MSIIVKRATKGSGLTSSEIDANVNNLNNDKVEINNPTFKAAPSLVNNLIPLTGTVLPAINPSLNLDFANGKQLDPRITFSRNTVATYCDGKTTKLAEQNLFLWSQDFSNAVWNKTSYFKGTLTANVAVAPDGTTTACSLVENTVSGDHQIYKTSAVPVSLSPISFSVYVKWISGTRNVGLSVQGSGGNTSTVIFNNTGAYVTTLGIGGETHTSTSVGNGWYRFTQTITSTNGWAYGFITLHNGIAEGAYTGDGTSGIYLWGAQLEQRAFASTYLPTTNTAITNYVSAIIAAPAGVPRFDYDPVTKKPLGLLIEELRTNSLVNSTIDGVNLATQDITTNAVARTLSFYGSGKVVLSGTATATITGLGAYPTRTTYTYTPTAGTLTLTVSGTVQYANDEVGSFATSYIPTAGTEKSRAADTASMTGVNFSSWYNQSEGTIYCNIDHLPNADNIGGRYFCLNSTAGRFADLYAVNGYLQQYSSIPTLTNLFTIATKAYNVAFSCNISTGIGIFAGNGAISQYAPGTAAAYPPSTLWIGSYNGASNLNGHIRKLTYYPKALTSQELIGLTS